MPDYRRYRTSGAGYFFTVNLLERWMDHLVDHIDLFRKAVRAVRQCYPSHIDAWVVLPDYLHCIWTLPEDDAESIRSLSNEELVRFRIEDPISGTGEPSSISLTNGHHRTAEIITRVNAGELSPDTIVRVLFRVYGADGRDGDAASDKGIPDPAAFDSFDSSRLQ